MKRWTLAAAIVGAVMYAAALSTELYNLTSPPALSWHILLRKIYSVVAFAGVGYLLRRALEEWRLPNRALTTILGMAAYSGAIEFGQALIGSKEGLAWNAIDVLCGALGGILAVAPRSRDSAQNR